jgi:ATP-dependent Zn protease
LAAGALNTHEERAQTLTRLPTEMGGFESNKNVVNEAAPLAARRDKGQAMLSDLEEAIESASIYHRQGGIAGRRQSAAGNAAKVG